MDLCSLKVRPVHLVRGPLSFQFLKIGMLGHARALEKYLITVIYKIVDIFVVAPVQLASSQVVAMSNFKIFQCHVCQIAPRLPRIPTTERGTRKKQLVRRDQTPSPHSAQSGLLGPAARFQRYN